MAENLRSIHYANGDSVTYYYQFENDSLYNIYGTLYNWIPQMHGEVFSNTNPSGVQGICPTGWHMPSEAEYQELATFLGGTETAGGKMKEAGTYHWIEPNLDATNSAGFSALPAGAYTYDWTTGEYIVTNLGQLTSFLTSHNIIGSYPYHAYIQNTESILGFITGGDSWMWVSIRCVKD